MALRCVPVVAHTGGAGEAAALPSAAPQNEGGATSGAAGAPGPAAARSTPVHGISGSADEALAFFSADAAAGTLTVTASRSLPKGGVSEVAVRPDGRVAATAHWDGRVRLWHARRRTPLGVLRYHSKAAAAVAFGWSPPSCDGASGSRDSALCGGAPLASGGRDGAVAVWCVYPPGGEGSTERQ